MCGKRMSDSIMSEEEEVPAGGDTQNGEGKGKKLRAGETEEEKLQRRREERKRRIAGKRLKSGVVVTKTIAKKTVNFVNRVWEEENDFVMKVMECLPEVRQPGLLLDEEEKTEEYVSVAKKSGKGVPNEQKERQKALERIRKNLKNEGVELEERAKSYQELKLRLQQKLAGRVQEPNLEKREKKLKKKLKRAEEKQKTNKGKKLISQSASSAGNSTGGGDDATEMKTESSEKTPLKKKPVVKSNGEIVYSKFDFISNDARQNGMNGSAPSTLSGRKGLKSGKPTAEELLKQAVKHEKQIATLATKGMKSEAADLAVSQKWDTALKRAEGVKVKDDPYLLKKTIKKQEKLKQLTKKKWKERVEQVEKRKEAKQNKRQSNIQARKDDKKKKVKKIMRKRGRIV